MTRYMIPEENDGFYKITDPFRTRQDCEEYLAYTFGVTPAALTWESATAPVGWGRWQTAYVVTVPSWPVGSAHRIEVWTDEPQKATA